MATLGLALAVVIFLSTGAALPAADGTGLLLGTAMLAALGSSVRILFITPMIKQEEATASLALPHAARPIALLLIILAVQGFRESSRRCD